MEISVNIHNPIQPLLLSRLAGTYKNLIYLLKSECFCFIFASVFLLGKLFCVVPFYDFYDPSTFIHAIVWQSNYNVLITLRIHWRLIFGNVISCCRTQLWVGYFVYFKFTSVFFCWLFLLHVFLVELKKIG